MLCICNICCAPEAGSHGAAFKGWGFWVPEGQGMSAAQAEHPVSNLDSDSPGPSMSQTYSTVLCCLYGKTETEMETYWVLAQRALTEGPGDMSGKDWACGSHS